MAPRKATAAAKAFDGIVDYIRVKRLNPGDLLPAEQELCEIIGCSRSSIREAMRTLASLDIVEVRHGHGTYVSKMSLDPLIQGLILRVLLSTDSSLTALLDIVDLRAAIDHSLAEELAEAWKSRDITPLLNLVNNMREHHKREESFALDDRAFHKTLLAPIKNPLTKELSDAFWQVHMTVLPPLNIELPEDVKHTIDAHQAMVEALHAGNAKKFNKLVDKHYAPLRNSIARYAKLEQNNPNDTA